MKYLLHLPDQEPVNIDLDKPLEGQLYGKQLEDAKKMLEILGKSMALGMRGAKHG